MKSTPPTNTDQLPPPFIARRWSAVILIGFVIAAFFLGRTLESLSFTSGDSSNWMPEGTEQREELDWFTERFGVNDMLLLSWEGCKAEDPFLSEFAAYISAEDIEQAETENRPTYFETITEYNSLRQTLDSSFFSKEEMDQRVRESLGNFLIGNDNGAGLMVLAGTKFCADNRVEALDFVKEIAYHVLGDDAELRFAGPTFISVSASNTTRKTLNTVAPLSALLGFIVSLIMLRQWTMSIACFIISGLAALFSMAAIHLSGKSMGDLLVIVPSLSQLLAMSNAIHFFNYYSEEYQRVKDPNKAWRYALRVGWLPTVAATTTTIIGFASLSTSNLHVASDFALFGGIAVGISAFTVLLAMPALLILMQPKTKDENAFQKVFISGLDWATYRLKWPITISMSALLIFGVFGITHLKSDIRLENFFQPKSEFIRDFKWYSNHFAAPQVSELIVTFPLAEGDDQTQSNNRTKFQYINNLTQEILDADRVEYAIFSPMLFASGLPDPSSKFPMPDEQVAGFFDQAAEVATKQKWIHHDADGEHWRVSVRHPAAPTPDESKFQQEIQRIMSQAPAKLDPTPSLLLTGEYQLFSNSQNSLLRQLLHTFLLAFVIITPLIIIFLRSFKMGLIAILGNIFPLVVFFGILGWMGNRIDIAMMTIAAVGFGIAVDDTVHYLTWLGRGFKEKVQVHRAVRYAFHNCSVAILQTTMILSIGMLGYFWGEFGPSVRFGISSAAVLVIALIGDLLFLPAIIRCFSTQPDLEHTTIKQVLAEANIDADLIGSINDKQIVRDCINRLNTHWHSLVIPPPR